MSVKGLAASAAEMAGTRMVGNEANRTIQSMPKQKQGTIRGILMVATAIMLISSGLKMLRNRNAH